MGDLSGELLGSSSESALEGLSDASCVSLCESGGQVSSEAGAGSSESSQESSGSGARRKRNGPDGADITDGDLRDIPPRGQ